MLIIEDFHTALRSRHPSGDHLILWLLILGVFRDLESKNGDKVTILNLPVMDNFHLTLQHLAIMTVSLLLHSLSLWQYYQTLQKKEELTAGTQGIPSLNIFLETMNTR